jgi:hypothetical protein
MPFKNPLRAPITFASIAVLALTSALGCTTAGRSETGAAPPEAVMVPGYLPAGRAPRSPSLRSVAKAPPRIEAVDPARVRTTQPENVAFISPPTTNPAN